jgi:hypothetical protein
MLTDVYIPLLKELNDSRLMAGAINIAPLTGLRSIEARFEANGVIQ